MAVCPYGQGRRVPEALGQAVRARLAALFAEYARFVYALTKLRHFPSVPYLPCAGYSPRPPASALDHTGAGEVKSVQCGRGHQLAAVALDRCGRRCRD